MGYRSDVAILLTKEAVDVLNSKLDSNDIDENVRQSVQRLLYIADAHHIDARTCAEVWHWEWIKWYSDDIINHADIKFIENFLSRLNADDYLFIRIGENYEDIEIHGSSFDSAFNIELVRYINIDVPDKEVM